ncbi:enoyl-CoA hydratase/isomerase family protein [Brevibacterium litoralis]|uniref:enoyl-CoA hydratase/isomerase family protein n=1 Tax=Brevibacterium litoralis TaxID=3138935 RepID=UPI0032F0552C
MTAAPGAHSVPLVEGFDLTVDGGVGTLVIDRQDRRNALSRAMWHALPGIVAAVDEDPSIRVLVLTGAGDHFSAGSDIHDLDVPLPDFWATNAEAEAVLAECRIPTIAAIRGTCVGGGTELACACDFRIAAPGSRFGVTAAKLGLVYPPGPTRRLAQVVGTGWAKYLLTTGNLIDTERADRLGLLHEVSEDPLTAAYALAATITSRSPLSQTASAHLLAGHDFTADQLDWLAGAYAQEITEGQAAFFERRPPEFTLGRTDFPT